MRGKFMEQIDAPDVTDEWEILCKTTVNPFLMEVQINSHRSIAFRYEN